MRQEQVTLLVVESEAPDSVTMYNSFGCDLGTWSYREWCEAIAKGDIIVQAGDKFVME